MEEVDKSCNSEERCLLVDDCISVQKRRDDLRGKNKTELESLETKEEVHQLKSRVCNRAQDAFCCPPPKPVCSSSQTCVPRLKCPSVRSLFQARSSTKKNSKERADISKIIVSLVCANPGQKGRVKYCCESDTVTG